jgi:chorismate mutase
MTRAVSGAIQVAQNARGTIHEGASRLVNEMLSRNGIQEREIVSILFSLTDDLTAANPATGLRAFGFASTPLFCCQEPRIEGAMPRVIRILLTWESESPTERVPVYLEGAAALRPDLEPSR